MREDEKTAMKSEKRGMIKDAASERRVDRRSSIL
jgi:hypothetical protein